MSEPAEKKARVETTEDVAKEKAAAAAAAVPSLGWVDLPATDLERAKAFYTSAFGWKATLYSTDPEYRYYMIKAGEDGDGLMGSLGLRPVKEGTELDTPDNVVVFVRVDDLAAASEAVTKAGGKVLPDPIEERFSKAEMENPDKTVLVQDTEGNRIYMWTEAAGYKGEARDSPLCWISIPAKDMARSSEFYTKAFGWNVSEYDKWPKGEYAVWMAGNPGSGAKGRLAMGGVCKVAEDASLPSAPTVKAVVYVEDIKATMEKITQAGGKLEKETPDHMPGIGSFVCFTDTEGAPLAVMQPDPPMAKDAAKAE